MVDPIADWLAVVDTQQVRRNSNNAAQQFAMTQSIVNQLDIRQPTVPVITVAGTNGKGSCVALLESIYLAAGYRVAATTSPHISQFNERVRLNGQPIAEQRLYQALVEVDRVRQDVALSPFTLLCLAALKIFMTQPVDVIIIEVGIGGRYDPANIIDADLAVITSIALDHCALLGYRRDQIAGEKAGIMRPQRPVICGDRQPPQNLEMIAQQQQAPFYQLGRDFDLISAQHGYSWQRRGGAVIKLPPSNLFTDNIASAVMAIDQLQPRLPVKLQQLYQGVAQAYLPARCHYIHSTPALLVDVAHNIAAVERLVDHLATLPCQGKKYALFAWLADKDGEAMVSLLTQQVACWYLAKLDNPRAADVSTVADWLTASNRTAYCFDLPDDAFQAVMATANREDMVIIFGSFHLIGELWPLIKERI